MQQRETNPQRNSRQFAALCDELLRSGLKVRFRASGESMRPSISNDDAVTVAPVAAGEVSRGDIVLTRGDGGLRVHRVAQIHETSGEVITRGDSGQENDAPAQQILGKVITAERDGKESRMAGTLARLKHSSLAFMHRVKLSAARRFKQIRSVSALFALLVVFGALSNAAPAAAQADLTMTQATSVSVVDRGVNFNYTEIVTNNGPNAVPAGTLVVYQQVPPNTTLQSITVDANWTCTNPGPIICTYVPALASGANTAADSIVFTLRVNAGTAYGTTVLNSATVTSQTLDPVPSNNTSVTTVLVEAANQADMAISMTAAPTPVFLFSNLAYTIKVQNLGQLSAATVKVVDTIPAGTTFVSANAPAGWTCVGAATVTCSLAGTMAQGASATITITVTSPSSPGPITNTAQVTSSTADPVAANNSATVITVVQPLVCATPGKDGAGGVLSGVVNTYYRASANGTLAAGNNVVALAAALPAGGKPIAVGDLLLIIQMQDALLNNTNTSSYGDGLPGDPASGSTNLQSTGQFEYVTATNAVPLAGGALTFTGTGANGGALNTYVRAAYNGAGNVGQQRYEVIRVPQYTAATLSSALVALPWDGNLGGVLAIDVASQLTLGGTVSADALGFRGGGGLLLTGSGGGVSTDYVSQSANNTDGSKGEGIAGTPRYIAPAIIINTTTPINTGVEGYSNGSFARGAPGNAGGGGTDGDPPANDENSGGGAGGNGGTGGLGGYGWNTFLVLNSTDGGFGGALFPATTSAVVMGGGGGAGTTNNGSYFISAANHDSTSTNPGCANVTCTGIFSSGGAGGGIVIVHTGSAAGAGTITANGQTTLSTDNDSTGGGGAGGSIIFFANTGALAGLTANANGGSAGNAWPAQAPGAFAGNRHGPGGGGGGGVILLSSAPAAMTVTGGANGYTNTNRDSFGATPGSAGVTATNHSITETPGTQPGAYCAKADLSVTNAGSPNPVLAGNNITYTQVVSNAGPLDAVNAVFTEAIPANTVFQSIAPPAGWTCNSTVNINSTGIINCTNPDVASGVGGTGTFMVVVRVNVGTPFGTQIVDVAGVSSGTSDPNLANNSALVSIAVGTANTADNTITNSGSPNPVLAGNNITFTQIVGNNGPASSPTTTVTEDVPVNTAFVSATGPAGWICTNTSTITCVGPTLGVGATATITVVVKVGAAVPAGTIITDNAMVGSGIEDPNTANNFATATVVVATAGQADLAMTASATPNPVLGGGNITYTQTFTNNGPASVPSTSNVTVTEAIPANTTFISFTNPNPALWSCITPAVGTSAPPIQCAYNNPGPAIAQGQSYNFRVVVKVGVSTPPSSTPPFATINSSITTSSTVSDPVPGNNTATTKVFVASPTQADVAILKTASPEPVNQGTNLTYTLQVTNNGPAVATGVSVSDPLPPQVSYLSASTTQGGPCTQAAGTVTCPIGSISVGGLVIVTINVTANTFSSASTASNTATVSATTSDPNSSNNTSTTISTIQSPTAVQLVAFTAMPRSQDGMLLEWKTREEVRNLGFNVYRENAQGLHRVNPSLIAGAALMLRGGRPQHGAKTYQWLDPSGTAATTYWIEDVDLNGTRTTHGPARVDFTTPQTRPVAQATLLRQLNSTLAPALAVETGRVRVPVPISPVIDAGVYRVNLEDVRAVKISVRSEGWYRVTGAQLVAAGLDPDADVRRLQLFAEGIEQPIRVLGRQSGSLSANDAIAFYGTGIDTPYSDTRVYWLIESAHSGMRIPEIPAESSGLATAQSFPFSVVHEDHTTYFATLLNGVDNDNFFGALVTSMPTDQALTITQSDSTSGLPITVDVRLQGVTQQQAHRVSVFFNGDSIGEMDFSDQANSKSSFSVEPSQLQDGVNTVTLTALEGDNDVSLVQSIVLHYAHKYAADTNWLRATVHSGDTVQITGFTSSQIHVVDVTNPLGVEELVGAVHPEGPLYSVTLRVPSAGATDHTILAFGEDQISSPAGLAFHARSKLAVRRDDAVIVMIAHPDFVSSLAPLVRLRNSQGLEVALVTTDQIFDDFNYGERSPYAIRQFLQQAATRWQRHLKSVLLVGDASLDPRNYLGIGNFDFVPTRMIETAAFKTASDDWFTDFQQTGYATIPTGRLPVSTQAEAALVVSKIVNYEQGTDAGAWNQQALFIADQNIGVDFTSETNQAVAQAPAFLHSTKILADGQVAKVVQQQILAQLSEGSLLVNYMGHGSNEQWSFSDLFDDTSARALNNGGRTPVYLLMDCLNGFFQDVYTESLAEALLLAPHGGAVAVWASSGFTDSSPQATMDQAFLQILAAHPSLPIGSIILNAKSGIADNDVRRTWILFGDPAMRLQTNSKR